MKKRYKRTTVDRWAFDALLIMFIISILFIALMLITQKINAKTEFISPLSDAIIIERTTTKIVEKPVYDYPTNPEAIIDAVFGSDATLAKKVAKCESGLNPMAANSTSSARGLFQVMQSWHKIDAKWLFNPMINTLVAKKLFDESGGSFSPHWNASKHCWGK
jgi:hypothetical protein